MLSTLFHQRKAGVLAIAMTLLAVGGVFAYFTSQTSVTLGSIQAAQLSVSASASEAFAGDQWLPGEEKTATWSITNTGTTPVFVKGYLNGTWAAPELDSAVVSVVRIERLSDGNWVLMQNELQALGAEFFHSPTGEDAGLLALAPAETAQYRVTAMLDSGAGDEYQLQNFVAELHVAARQITDGATWPIMY